MKPLQWTLLCAIFVFYLLFGGSIFMVLEQHHEKHHKEEMSVLRKDIQEQLFHLDRDFYRNDTNREELDALKTAKEGVIKRISEACGGNDLLETTQVSNDTPLRWNYYNSVFYAFTVITTIGYGHLSPQTNWSKIFTMFYALVGIPINGILICGLGDYFSSKLVKLHKRSKEKKYKGKLTLVVEITFYLIPGLIVFLIIPAGIFVLTESWTFLDSFYYAFITLTTIGFGDFVAGMGDGHNVGLWIYKVFIIVWIIFGLGYLVMILGFITKGLKKSKRVRVVIEKRLNGIRTTKEKLTRDVEYMRRVVNELYLMKVKPIYDDDGCVDEVDNKHNRSIIPSYVRTHSQPNIMQRKHSSLPRRENEFFRNRRYSAVAGTRTMSETDLDIIDDEQIRKWTKERYMDSAKLLASVVTALSMNTMGNVMNAVDELNKYEEEVLAEGVKGKYSDSRQKKGSPEFVDMQDWDMEILEESDEDILIVSHKNENKTNVTQNPESQLEHVIIHKNEGHSRKTSKTDIIGKVTEAFRKISTGTKGSDPPSRKISRNENERRRKISRQTSRESEGPTSRKISMNEYPERKISSQKNYYQQVNCTYEEDEFNGHDCENEVNISANDHYIRSCQGQGISPADFNESNGSSLDNSLKTETNGDFHNDKNSQKKISEISQASSSNTCEEVATAVCSPSSRKKPNFISDASSGNSSRVNSRKVTPDSFPVCNRRLSVEQTSLAHFLKALDAVHEKLNVILDDKTDNVDVSDSCSSTSTDSSYYPPRKLSCAKTAAPRHRKIGVFNPDFSFVNNGFATEQESKGKTKECIEK